MENVFVIFFPCSAHFICHLRPRYVFFWGQFSPKFKLCGIMRNHAELCASHTPPPLDMTTSPLLLQPQYKSSAHTYPDNVFGLLGWKLVEALQKIVWDGLAWPKHTQLWLASYAMLQCRGPRSSFPDPKGLWCCKAFSCPPPSSIQDLRININKKYYYY